MGPSSVTFTGQHGPAEDHEGLRIGGRLGTIAAVGSVSPFSEVAAPELGRSPSSSPLMARYYFDFLDRDGLVVDAEGREIDGLHNVKIEAARSLVELARDFLMATTPLAVEQLSIQVRDGTGPIMKVHFSFHFETTN